MGGIYSSAKTIIILDQSSAATNILRLRICILFSCINLQVYAIIIKVQTLYTSQNFDEKSR